jgi:hypothetical protein
MNEKEIKLSAQALPGLEADLFVMSAAAAKLKPLVLKLVTPLSPRMVAAV